MLPILCAAFLSALPTWRIVSAATGEPFQIPPSTPEGPPGPSFQEARAPQALRPCVVSWMDQSPAQHNLADSP